MFRENRACSVSAGGAARRQRPWDDYVAVAATGRENDDLRLARAPLDARIARLARDIRDVFTRARRRDDGAGSGVALRHHRRYPERRRAGAGALQRRWAGLVRSRRTLSAEPTRSLAVARPHNALAYEDHRNPEYRLWMATTPPEDDAHFSYELCAYPPGTIFEPSATGSWYQNDSGLRIHRVSAADAELAGVHLYDSRTRQPIPPEEHRQRALDKTAWDRTYGLIFTQGGISAVPLLVLEQAQTLGAQMGCIFAEDELPPDWDARIDPQFETAIGIDPATTEKEKSNPTGVAVLQLVDGKHVARLIFRYRTADPQKSRALIREICSRAKPRTVAIDATSERYWAAELKEELEPVTDVLLIVNSERIIHNGESMTLKTYLGNIGVAAIEDRTAALPPAW